MANQKSSTVEVFLKFILVFVIALCSFAVGTFVGQKFSEDQNKLVGLKSGSERGVASVSPDATDVKPESALSHEDIASLEEEFSEKETSEIQDAIHSKQVSAEKMANSALDKLERDLKAKGTTAPVAKAVEGETGGHGSNNGRGYDARAVHAKELAAASKKEQKLPVLIKDDEVSQVAERIAKDEKPLEAAKINVSRVPSSLPGVANSSPIGKFTVQIASYKTEGEAKNHAADLKGKGFGSYYVKAEVNGQTWYRVAVGQFNEQAEANNYMKQIYKEANLKGFVTKVTR